MSEDRQERFTAYVEALAEVIGPADRLAPVSAAGVDGRRRAPRRFRHPRDGWISDQAGDRAGADPGGLRGRSAARRCADGMPGMAPIPGCARRLALWG